MVREGAIEMHQHAAFAPIYLRKRGGRERRAPAPGVTAVTRESNEWAWRNRTSTTTIWSRRDGRDEHDERHRWQRPEELRLIEALLFAAGEPLDEKTLAQRLPEGVDIASAMRRLQAEYAPRGVNLVRIAGKWTFRTANDLAWLLTREVGRAEEALARRASRRSRSSPITSR